MVGMVEFVSNNMYTYTCLELQGKRKGKKLANFLALMARAKGFSEFGNLTVLVVVSWPVISRPTFFCSRDTMPPKCQMPQAVKNKKSAFNPTKNVTFLCPKID
jgi:hypothetical protein